MLTVLKFYFGIKFVRNRICTDKQVALPQKYVISSNVIHRQIRFRVIHVHRKLLKFPLRTHRIFFNTNRLLRSIRCKYYNAPNMTLFYLFGVEYCVISHTVRSANTMENYRWLFIDRRSPDGWPTINLASSPASLIVRI